jgi:hypothetical protein
MFSQKKDVQSVERPCNMNPMIIDTSATYESRSYFLYLCISSLSTCSRTIEICPFLFKSDGSPYLNNIKTPIMSNVNPITLIICCVVILSNCVDFAVSVNLQLTFCGFAKKRISEH